MKKKNSVKTFYRQFYENVGLSCGGVRSGLPMAAVTLGLLRFTWARITWGF